MSWSILIFPFGNMCITIRSLNFSMVVLFFFFFVWFRVCFLLGNKQEVDFGGVISV